jgi:hypothetical protein
MEVCNRSVTGLGGGVGGKFSLLFLLGTIGAAFVQADMNTRRRYFAGAAPQFATA